MTGPTLQESESGGTHRAKGGDMVALIEELEAFVNTETDGAKPEFCDTYEVSCLSCS